MTGYEERPTQEQRILDLYNTRIWELRQKGFVIENKTPDHFLLTNDIEFDQNGQRKII